MMGKFRRAVTAVSIAIIVAYGLSGCGGGGGSGDGGGGDGGGGGGGGATRVTWASSAVSYPLWVPFHSPYVCVQNRYTVRLAEGEFSQQLAEVRASNACNNELTNPSLACKVDSGGSAGRSSWGYGNDQYGNIIDDYYRFRRTKPSDPTDKPCIAYAEAGQNTDHYCESASAIAKTINGAIPIALSKCRVVNGRRPCTIKYTYCIPQF